MLTIADIARFLEGFAPSSLAEDWDNVGLLVGDAGQPADRVMTCLTITPASASEAVSRRAQLIVTHHPLPFKPLKQLTSETTSGRLLLQLIRNGIAVYSPHTAFDSAAQGINQQFAEGLGLTNVRPLIAKPNGDPSLGSGRYGLLPASTTLGEIAARLKQFVKVGQVQFVGDLNRSVERIAIACGSAGSFLAPAVQAKCDVLITGETTFHTCLEAEATDIALLLPGHFASERFGVERLALVLAKQFPQAEVWASKSESDPIKWL
jgi:dinuclear metal center YbgI/SA1388 family protein